jgi:protein LTV1
VVRDLGALPDSVARAADADVVLADDDDELDADVLAAIGAASLDAAAVDELQDDFVLLANDGFVGGATLTEDNLTRAQRAARADYLAEMMSDDDDDDDDDDDYGYDDDGLASDDADLDSIDEQRRGAASTRSVRSAVTRYTRSEAGKTTRSEALQTLDQRSVAASGCCALVVDTRAYYSRFDEFEKQYADDQIGDLEEEADDIGGEVDEAQLAALMNEFLDEQRDGERKTLIEPLHGELRATTLRLAQQQLAEPTPPLLGANASRANALAARDAPAWDAQSYTSLFSTTENHPSVIDAPPRASKARRAADAAAPAPGASTEEIVRFRLTKTGMPIAGLPPRASNDNAADDDDDDNAPLDPATSGVARPANETRAAKAARKAAVKEAKRLARQRKKQSRVEQRHHDSTHSNALALQGPKKIGM